MTRRGWVLFAAMSVIWGVPYLLIKVAVEEMSVPALVVARTAVGAALLLPLALLGWGNARKAADADLTTPGGPPSRLRRALASGRAGFAAVRREWVAVLAFGVIEIVLPWGLLTDAEQRISSSLTSLLIAAVPVIAVVLTRATGGTERITPARMLGLAIGTGGVALLAIPGANADGVGLRPVAELLAVAFCYAAAPLIAARRLGDVPPLPLTATCLSLATVVWIGPAVANRPSELPSGRVLAAVLALALACTALAFVLFFELIREVGNDRAVVVSYVNPAIAVAAGVMVLDEPLAWTSVVAFGLILAGSVLATRRPSDRPPTRTTFTRFRRQPATSEAAVGT